MIQISPATSDGRLGGSQLIVVIVISALLIVGVAVALTRPQRLGPLDDLDLPPTDLERVQVGAEAPDFRLLSFDGTPVRLSQFRGDYNVVLSFYRGHW